jgi:DNA polymerase-4
MNARVLVILHVDMDAFYASVEQRDDPRLRGKPVIVGGPSRRGVVSAASYEARPFGVRSAMPMGEALRRCPQAIVVPVNMGRYQEVSASVFEVFRRFTPLVEGLSLDEAFLDVTASRSLFGEGVDIARAIKAAIRSELSLVASAGVAPCKFAAKIASDLEKPDGLTVVPPDGVAEFLAPLPIERMWGVGPKTAPRLRAEGFATLGDLAAAQAHELERLLGTWGTRIRELARGNDPRAVEPDREAKSIGAEVTHEVDLTSREDVGRALLGHASKVAQRLHHEGLHARGVVVKLKYSDFSVRSRQTLLPEPVADTASIHRAAERLLASFPSSPLGIRLTGISVSHLGEGPPPRVLFPDVAQRKRTKVEGVIAAVEGRLGVELTRATLLDPSVRKRPTR